LREENSTRARFSSNSTPIPWGEKSITIKKCAKMTLNNFITFILVQQVFRVQLLIMFFLLRENIVIIISP